MSRGEDTLEGKLAIDNYVVCLVDLLGQSEKLREWPELPKTKSEETDFLPHVLQTLRPLTYLDDAFKNYFREFGTARFSQHPVQKLTGDAKLLADRALNCTFKRQQFSDTFLFYAPVIHQFDDVNAEAMFRMLSACAMAMIYGLVSGFVVRGAISVGV